MIENITISRFVEARSDVLCYLSEEEILRQIKNISKDVDITHALVTQIGCDKDGNFSGFGFWCTLRNGENLPCIHFSARKKTFLELITLSSKDSLKLIPRKFSESEKVAFQETVREWQLCS